MDQDMIIKAKENIKIIENKLQEDNPDENIESRKFNLGIISLKLQMLHSFIENNKRKNNQALKNIKFKYNNLINEYEELKDKLEKEFNS